MTTIETFKSQAKLLRAHLSAIHISLTHSQSLEAVAAMHGHRDWNTAVGASNSAAEVVSEPELPLVVFVAPETTEDELRADVINLLRRAPRAIRFRLDTGITLEQARFARSIATDVEQVDVRVEFDSPV